MAYWYHKDTDMNTITTLRNHTNTNICPNGLIQILIPGYESIHTDITDTDTKCQCIGISIGIIPIQGYMSRHQYKGEDLYQYG